MSMLTIKIIASITMIFDHIKYAIPITNNFVTEYFGRLSFPLFAFLITEGYIHTSNLERYYKRLIIGGVISQIPFMLFRTLVGEWLILNIMFTLVLGLFAITIYDKIKNKFISLTMCAIIMWLGYFINVDYSWFGVATVLLFYVLKDRKLILPIAYVILICIFLVSSYMPNYSNIILLLKDIKEIIFRNILFIIFTLLPVFIIMFYNGKQGKKIKSFFYVFYPLHMLILYLINYIVI